MRVWHLAAIAVAIWVFIIVAIVAARAETMVFERVVPAGATLSYAEGGSVLRTIAVPEGRVRVVVTYGGGIVPRHRRQTGDAR